MRIPIKELVEYLDTQEMYDTNITKLNNGEFVEHTVIGISTPVEIKAYLDADFDIRWTILRDFTISMEDVPTSSLRLEIKELLSLDG